MICANGTFLTSSYEEGGECERLTFAKFVKSDSEAESDAAVSPWSGAGGASGTAANNSSSKVPMPPVPPPSVVASLNADSGDGQSDMKHTSSTVSQQSDNLAASSKVVAKKLEEINIRK